MNSYIRPAISLYIVLTILTGIIYPGVVTAIAQAAFPDQANGSLISHDGELVGSKLIGQHFSGPEYFWGRLSATQPFPYNAAASSGSNFGPMHPLLKEAAAERLSALAEHGTKAGETPVDLVTASASGLDPHISPAAALVQVARVAAVRKLAEETVERLVQGSIEERQWGVYGEPRVNVLLLNLALDRLQTTK